METSRLQRLAAPAAALAAAIFTFQGCTLAGWAIGAAVDAGQPDSTTVSAWGMDSLKKGMEVTVWLRNGAVVAGTVSGVGPVSLGEYRKRYSEFLAAQDTPPEFPAPDDSVVVVHANGDRYPWRFLAYDYNYIMVERQPIGRTRINAINIGAVLFHGRQIPWVTLREWFRSAGVPLLTGLAVVDKPADPSWGIVNTVNPADIVQIQYKNSKDAKSFGLFAGLVVDAVIVIVVLTNQPEQSKPAPTTTGGKSCPFVYSHDGKEFVLDSETFSGAVLPSLARTAVDRMDHLADGSGVCRLRITNELDETQYVDELRLLAVDHPPGTQVAPAPGTTFRAVSRPQRPLAATDFRNNLVTRLVAANDRESWLSNPTGRNPRDPATVRDGLTLRFSRPAGSRTARLLLCLKNTPWATEMEMNLMRLSGRDLPEWEEAINSSAARRESFVELAKREAMLSVSVWDGGSWRLAEYVPFVGPLVEKPWIVEADLEGTPEGELRVRLESTAGLWQINSVEADFAVEPAARARAATLAAAVDEKGADRVEALSAIDGRHYVLEPGDGAELAFRAPERVAGWSRSYLLLSTGYYRVHMVPEGEPRWDVVRWLGSEPGAFGSYSAGIVNAWLERQTAPRPKPASGGAEPAVE